MFADFSAPAMQFSSGTRNSVPSLFAIVCDSVIAVLLDLYPHEVVGWAMGCQQNRPLVIDALTMTIAHRRPKPGLIHHTDQGVLYASADYRAILTHQRMIPSMSRKGDCCDNAMAESLCPPAAVRCWSKSKIYLVLTHLEHFRYSFSDYAIRLNDLTTR